MANAARPFFDYARIAQPGRVHGVKLYRVGLRCCRKQSSDPVRQFSKMVRIVFQNPVCDRDRVTHFLERDLILR